jgi:hypothetical protein
MNSSGSTPSPRRPSLYSLVWVFYLIALVGIARCFETPDYAATLPSESLSHLATVLGLPSFDTQSCAGDCGAQPVSNGWSRPLRIAPSNGCTDIPTNPDLQAGCGFIAPVSDPEPTPGPELSAAPTDDLPPSIADNVVASDNPHTTSHGLDDTSALP